MKFNRVITLVMDSVGIGAAKDSLKYGDEKSVNTLGNISRDVGLDVPKLESLGLGNINSIKTVKEVKNPRAHYGKMIEKADGKDTITGHWEMMGCTLDVGFNQYVKSGFDKELIEEFESRVGRKVIANKEASGMKVIKEYYDEHMATGSLIVYTSVDSTFQIAAHEDVVSVKELYRACEIARELTKNPKYNVARVIARPFLGDKDNYYRTSNRHDYALRPSEKTVLEKLVENKYQSVGIGKISDVFSGYGISKSYRTKNNMDGVDKLILELKKEYTGHIFVNLVDFDANFGHPRDVVGYKKSLEEFDSRIDEIIKNLKDDDILIITADHGNDPTYKGNDHTRENVPLLVFHNKIEIGKKINDRETFEDLGETICENFDLDSTKYGKSFLKELK